MPKYECTAASPVPDPDGVLVHPGDIFDLDEPPSWPARLLDEPETPAAPPATPAPAPAAPAPPAATTATPVATSTPPPDPGKQA